MSLRVAIVGTGPAGLMAASTLTKAGVAVTLFEKNKGPGHKLLIAGGSGLNISNALPPQEFIAQYTGNIGWMPLFEKFSVA
ncbi:MAG: NAD(P)/FAD-dependent oxidoreductase, partial [Spirochaetes bacterium]|nr:NAD(P)/FAD-dependent oxidoreductase [Spirochaetota bacterium]